ncbi:S26 family signal peptidase [Salinarchaeum laminariae]|uniref:S26 family signal peptidase n=1 Tax=Salinarchaeum laminariae TaxID=869888 RepID=UPI0020BF16CC|nr:S26 family signal peptidase [Salinarchaeum laminariae]
MSNSGGGAPTRDEDVAADDNPGDDSVDDPSTQPAEPAREDARVPPRQPPAASGRAQSVPDPTSRPLLWYFRSDRPLVIASRDILSSVVIVAILGLALFAVSGVWPPLVAVESGSMQPNMEQGDLVLVVEEDRFASQLADEHGIVTHANASGTEHQQFGRGGSVIVYKPDGDDGTPIIHRAVLWVDQGENWIDRADPTHLGSVDECSDVPQSCPAPHSGYVTRGDANQNYDQIDGQSTVVKPAWIRGRAVTRTPYLGCVRLALSEGGICGA